MTKPRTDEGIESIARNTRARHDYEILETWEAGLMLLGTEVKSLRDGRAQITDAYAVVKDGEVWLLNAHIAPYSHGNVWNHEPTRSRKLLLHAREIRKLIGAVERKGLTLVALELYFRDGRAKVRIGLARGKKLHDKRADARERDAKREMARAIRTVKGIVLALGLGLGVTTSVAAAPPGPVIRVRSAAGDTAVAVVESPSGGVVRADVVARLLGGRLEGRGPGRWRLAVGSAAVEIESGSPFATYNGFALPLVEAPRMVDGAPAVPLQLFSEILPRFDVGVRWDRTTGELRRDREGAVARAASGDPVRADRSAGPRPESDGVDRGGPAPSAVAATPAAAAPRLSRPYTVVVDAGHGGRDPGMRGALVDGRALSEARITLEIAKRVKAELEALGLRVLMTRTTDTLINLFHRGPIANRASGDLFVSVHVNGANPKWNNPTAARGFETFYLSTARTEDEAHVAAMENDVVHFETEADAPRGNDALAFILNDLARNEHLRESKEIAAAVQRRLAGIHPGPNRGVKQAGLAVLSTAYMPAVLVEVGFGSNPAEARWMSSDAGQADAARAIAGAAHEYLVDYDRRRARPSAR
jgi:SsrA-binding protein